MAKCNIIILVALLATAGVSCGQSVPALMNYQGRLTDATGAPLPAGLYTIQYRIWDDPKLPNATLVWAQQQTNAVQANGVFSTLLGSPGGTPISGGPTPQANDISLAFTQPNRFLGITLVASNGVPLSSENEILPRQMLASVPYAIAAGFAEKARLASSLTIELSNGLCPAGTVVAYMGNNPPPGWLTCDGSEVSRTLYSGLFSVIGTASGKGDGATTFLLPDLRGVFLRGVAGNRSGLDPDSEVRVSANAGGNSGNSVGSYQSDQFGKHDHQTDATPIEGSLHLGTKTGEFSGGGGSHFGTGGDMRTSSEGGSETRPKNVYVNYIIKY